MKEEVKNALKDALEYIKKYRAKEFAFAFALVGAAVAFPPSIPFIAVGGATVAYVDYKKKNPKGSVGHFAKNTIQNVKNQEKLRMELSDIGRTIMQAKKRIAQKKNGLAEGETLQIVESPFRHAFKRKYEDVLPEIERSPAILSEDAKKAGRLNHIRMVNIRKEREK